MVVGASPEDQGLELSTEKTPADWEVRQIGEFAEVTAGGTPSTTVREFWGGPIKWMSSGELNMKKVYDVDGRITESGLRNSSAKLVPPKCVLIGLAGQGKTRGTVAMNFVELCTNQSIAAILPNKSYVPEYLYYDLDLRYEEMRSLSTGESGRGGLNLTIIRKIPIPFPPTIEEQKSIAEVLSDVDQLIEQLDELVAKKKSIKQGTMQDLLAGRRRLPEFGTADARHRETDIGKIPDDWDVSEIEQVAAVREGVYGKRIERGGMIQLRANSVGDDGKIDPDNYARVVIERNQIDQVLRVNDVVLNNRNSIDQIGKSAIYRGEFGSCVPSNLLTSIRVNSLAVLPEWLIFVLVMMWKEGVFKRLSTRAVNQVLLKKFSVERIRIPRPSIPEQLAISGIISDLDSEIWELEKRREKYIMIKQGVTQQLLTGRIRLR